MILIRINACLLEEVDCNDICSADSDAQSPKYAYSNGELHEQQQTGEQGEANSESLNT
jgi:hypothetical protein